MPSDASAYFTGRLLVAMPGIEDPRFERSVILLCAHDASHAMGITINRPVDGLTIAQLLKQLGVAPGPGALDADFVLMGGPVEQERGFVLHTDDHAGPAAGLEIGGGVSLTATREILEALAGRTARPRRALMALGYAGWDAGQLEREIRESVWLTCEADEGLLFDDDHEHKWSRALAKIGIAAEHLSAVGGRA
jgi:putative transcriptional regulator